MKVEYNTQARKQLGLSDVKPGTPFVTEHSPSGLLLRLEQGHYAEVDDGTIWNDNAPSGPAYSKSLLIADAVVTVNGYLPS